jgi:hypothetical protein
MPFSGRLFAEWLSDLSHPPTMRWIGLLTFGIAHWSVYRYPSMCLWNQVIFRMDVTLSQLVKQLAARAPVWAARSHAGRAASFRSLKG